jgi:N-acetylmuramoyl-L-alanine amidase
MECPIHSIQRSDSRFLTRLRLSAVGFLILLSVAGTAEAASSANKTSLKPGSPWDVIKVDGRDRLSVDNLAKFYGLPTGVAPVEKKISLENAKGSLEFTLNSREVMINGVRNWLAFPVVEKDGEYLVTRTDLAETIEPLLRPHMIPNVGKVKTVVIDPGHGGHDKGACSRYGCEKEYTLDVARQLRPMLQAKGFKVLMTREGDYFVPLPVRARIANAASDAIFVSIHFNATNSNPLATGFEIFSLTPRGAPSTDEDYMKAAGANQQNGTPVDNHSLQLSSCIYHSVLGHIPEYDRGIKRSRFAVLRLTKVPSILMEGGFMSDRAESRKIANKEWRGKLAQAISMGIDNYKSLADRKQKPLLVKDYTRKESDQFRTEFSLQPAGILSTPPPASVLPTPSLAP